MTEKKSSKKKPAKAAAATSKATNKATKAPKPASSSTAAVPKSAVGDTAFTKLNTWNKVLAVVFAVQAVLVVVFSKAVSVPVTFGYSAVDELSSNAAKHEVFAQASRHLFDARVAWALAAGLLVFAIGHLLMATVQRTRYESDLKAGVNRWRWADLGLGGGILVTAICLVSGVQQLALLVAILLFTVLATGLMLVNERLLVANKDVKHQVNHLLCVLAALCGAFASFVLLGGMVAGWLYDGKLPMYLYGIYGSALVLFGAIIWASCFRLARKGKWADSIYTERMYMQIGLATATLLTWQVVVGALL